MMKPVVIRGLSIGEGVPGIIAPILGKDRDEILRGARATLDTRIAMAEWRCDDYDQALDTSAVLDTLAALREVLGEKPLLFTFRTEQEGGERAISTSGYAALNQTVAGSGLVDLVDVQAFSENAADLIARLYQAGIPVIGSYHDFHATPSKEEMISRLRAMQDMGADIPKLAVMPTCTGDVLTLLAATAEMRERYADRPIITMSMAANGVVSRLAGEWFGSAMTFGAVGRASAPGQVSVDVLARALELLHGVLQPSE